MVIVALSAVGATLVAAILVALVYLTARKQQPELATVARWAARLWIFAFVVNLILLYIDMPALTGPYWGWQWVLWPLLLTGAFALFGGGLREMRSALDSLTEQINGEGPVRPIRGRYRTPGGGWTVDHQPAGAAAAGRTPRTGFLAGAGGIVAALLIATLVNGLIVAFTTWGDGNAKALAAIPTIQEQPTTSQLPPTDVNHIVLVTQGVAAYLGQQVLASGGKNLGSQYHTEQSEYTLQSVNHHLYWIAPLVYNNVWANVGNWQSPGYVVVDAEDPNSEATLKTGYHMRYLPDALLNQDLLRHVYLSGYTNGDLADPTLEVDDNWNPYFTISLMQPTRGFTGAVVRRVLLVDAQTGAIQNLAVDKVPSWVDRILPSDTVDDYLNWWGLYHSAPWFNPSGANQQAPGGTPELVYNTVDQPVWLVTMTSNSNKDQSSTGVVLFDTRDSTGKFYPLSGIGIGNNVTQTFAGNPANLQHYDVGSVQLYQIYGEPTWVATFVKSNDSGQNFAAVGMVDARHLTNANVIMAPDKAQALAAYAQYLAGANISTGVSPSGKQVTTDGKVVRISSATQNGSTVYYFTLEGQSKIFEAGLALSPKLPLVQPGDQVHFTFLDTGESTVTLTSFDDYSIQT